MGIDFKEVVWDPDRCLGCEDGEAHLRDAFELDWDLICFRPELDLEPERDLSPECLLVCELGLEPEWELFLECLLAQELGLEPEFELLERLLARELCLEPFELFLECLLARELGLEPEWELFLDRLLARELGLDPTGDPFCELWLATELDLEELLLAGLSGELDRLFCLWFRPIEGDSDFALVDEFFLLLLDSGEGDRDSASLFSGLLSSILDKVLWFSLSLWFPFSSSSSSSSEECWTSDPSSESESVSA